jgi:hypothetical protein
MKAFTEHPESVGETYFQHMGVSFRFGSKMLVASLGCFMHGIFPFLCVKTGSKTVNKLHHNMVTHRDKRVAPCDDKNVNLV